MLSQLYIKNIAVISEASIDFGPRFNVFTGESILARASMSLPVRPAPVKRFWFLPSTECWAHG